MQFLFSNLGELMEHVFMNWLMVDYAVQSDRWYVAPGLRVICGKFGNLSHLVVVIDRTVRPVSIAEVVGSQWC